MYVFKFVYMGVWQFIPGVCDVRAGELQDASIPTRGSAPKSGCCTALLAAGVVDVEEFNENRFGPCLQFWEVLSQPVQSVWSPQACTKTCISLCSGGWTPPILVRRQCSDPVGNPGRIGPGLADACDGHCGARRQARPADGAVPTQCSSCALWQ